MSKQKIFEQGDDYKVTFEALGTYKGHAFALYDYKGDKCVHIGGTKHLDTKGLVKELLKMISNTEPKKFKAKCKYTDPETVYKYR